MQASQGRWLPKATTNLRTQCKENIALVVEQHSAAILRLNNVTWDARAILYGACRFRSDELVRVPAHPVAFHASRRRGLCRVMCPSRVRPGVAQTQSQGLRVRCWRGLVHRMSLSAPLRRGRDGSAALGAFPIIWCQYVASVDRLSWGPLSVVF